MAKPRLCGKSKVRETDTTVNTYQIIGLTRSSGNKPESMLYKIRLDMRP